MASKNNLITKPYLKRELDKFGKKLVGELTQIKDDIMKELKDMRENDAVHQFSHQRINDDLQDHQGRIKKLEQQVT